MQALAVAGSHAQVPALIGLLKDPSQPSRVRVESAFTLGALRDDSAVPALSAILRDVGADASLRLMGEQALAQIGTKRAREALASARPA